MFKETRNFWAEIGLEKAVATYPLDIFCIGEQLFFYGDI